MEEKTISSADKEVLTSNPSELKRDLSKEDLDLITRGIRPQWLEYDKFKFLRKLDQKLTEKYLNGRLIHLSSVIETDKVTKITVRKTYKPYVKPVGTDNAKDLADPLVNKENDEII